MAQCALASEGLVQRTNALIQQRNDPPHRDTPAQASVLVTAQASALAVKLGSAAPCAADTSPATDLEMVLDTSMSEVLLQEDDFKRHVAADMSRAVGCDASQVEVVGIEAGSIMRRADGKGHGRHGRLEPAGAGTGGTGRHGPAWAGTGWQNPKPNSLRCLSLAAEQQP